MQGAQRRKASFQEIVISGALVGLLLGALSTGVDYLWNKYHHQETYMFEVVPGMVHKR